ncbi:hypothetical protein SAE02_42020 [Skermanella aerolata]|uniref:Uncharacterized protein n=1 Tax=Skermanella aerolata TaxID=393310 RepID=A0A512DUA2_9PROT|nr:hypothetical protein SAE02_42020 [Skermanella aerolata]
MRYVALRQQRLERHQQIEIDTREIDPPVWGWMPSTILPGILPGRGADRPQTGTFDARSETGLHDLLSPCIFHGGPVVGPSACLV